MDQADERLFAALFFRASASGFRLKASAKVGGKNQARDGSGRIVRLSAFIKIA